MRYFQTLFGGVVGIMSVTDLDDKTVIGVMRGGGFSIHRKELEVCAKCHLLPDDETCDEHNK